MKPIDQPRVYLDHAATSWPKPDAVWDAMTTYAKSCGAAAGRGSYRSAQNASGIVESVRQKIARMISAQSNSISFHANGTAALNAAIHGLVKPGSHVVTTAADHNSVLRPLSHLQKHHSVTVTTVSCDSDGHVSIDSIRDAIESETSLVAITHASNVTGAVQPIAKVGTLLKDHPALLLCDAAQTFGCLPINVSDLGVDLLAAPGHKGGLGPLGTAFLYANANAQDRLEPTIQGGTGGQSESLEMPEGYPAKMEAGNLNVPAIAGWAAGLDDLISGDPGPTRMDFAARIHEELSPLPKVRLFGKPSPTGTVSLSVEGLSVIDLATILDVEFNIEVRSGLHCAAMIHDFLGSAPEGTLRISTGRTTTHDEIGQVCDAIMAIVSEL